MSDKCTLTVNGKNIAAFKGQTLLEAALRGKVIIPQDCCTGQCSTCRVQVLSGAVDDQGTAIQDMVLGCTATLQGDAVIQYETVPNPVKINGEVSSIRYISAEIMEVLVQLPKPLEYMAGQYVSLTFAGFPSRDYSPTVFEDGHYDAKTLVFHIKRYEGGLISTAIDTKIKVGHKVKVSGPFGHAFFRDGNSRLILVASGTGFSPIWSVAREAVLVNPSREIIVVVGARHAANLYMSQSLLWLAENGVKNITVCASGFGYGGLVKHGRPTDFMPKLQAGDVVYAAGVPAMVDAVEKLAVSAGVICYADPFTMNHTGLSVMNRLRQAVQGPSKANPLSPRVQGAQLITTLDRSVHADRAHLQAKPMRQSSSDRQSSNAQTRSQR